MYLRYYLDEEGKRVYTLKVGEQLEVFLLHLIGFFTVAT